MSLRFAICSFCVGSLILLAAGSDAFSQLTRYQLGKQVIAFEEAFESFATIRPNGKSHWGICKKRFDPFLLYLSLKEKSIDLARLSLLPVPLAKC